MMQSRGQSVPRAENPRGTYEISKIQLGVPKSKSPAPRLTRNTDIPDIDFQGCMFFLIEKKHPGVDPLRIPLKTLDFTYILGGLSPKPPERT